LANASVYLLLGIAQSPVGHPSVMLCEFGLTGITAILKPVQPLVYSFWYRSLAQIVDVLSQLPRLKSVASFLV